MYENLESLEEFFLEDEELSQPMRLLNAKITISNNKEIHLGF